MSRLHTLTLWAAAVVLLASGAWLAPGALHAADTPETPLAALAAEAEAQGLSAPEAASLADAVAASLARHMPDQTEDDLLRASNDDATDQFGFSVSLSGDRALVGAYQEDGPTNGASASGAAYVFDFDGTVWTETAVLRASNAEAIDVFGYSVSLSGDRALVGAYQEDGPTNGASNAGAAYVFDLSGAAWTETAVLRASNAEAFDYFGWSVSLSGDRALVGAYAEDGPTNSALNAGAAYVFDLSGAAWTETAVLRASNAEAFDQFGWSVSLSGDRALVGAYEEDGPTNGASGSGAAYVFAFDGAAWTETAVLRASNAGAGDLFGYSVSLSGDRALVGAPGEDGPTNNTNSSGAAYTYALTPSGPPAPQEFVYWANNNTNTIGRSNLDGTGVNQSFIATGGSPRSITQDNQYIYWANTGSSSIGRANLDGTGVDNSFIAPGGSPYGLAVDKQYIYYSISSAAGVPGSIGRANLDGTGATTLVANAGNVLGIAIDTQYLYWGTGDTSGTIGRVNLDGTGANASFITGARRPFSVAVNGDYVYWANENAAGIGRANLDGTGVNQDFVAFPAPPPNSFPRGIALSDEYIYWADFGRNAIGRANLDGTGAVFEFITGASGPFAVGTASAVAIAPPLAATLTGVDGYRMLTHPAGGTVDDLLGSVWTEGFDGSDNDASTFCSVLTWDETNGGFDAGYECVPDQSAPVQQGTGVLAYIFADDDRTTPGTVDGGFPKALEVTGTGAVAPFSGFGITYTENATSPAYEQGWNLLGNPLGSAFDWDLATLGAALGGTVYVYDPNYLGGNYRSWTQGLGGDLPDGEVPAFQGFFVKANASGATLEIPEPAVVDTDPGVYGRTAETDADPLRVELEVTTASETAPVSVAFVTTAETAALGLDSHDAYRLSGGAWPRAALATWPLGEDEPAALALNALPEDASGEIVLPLSVTAEGYAAGPLAMSLTWTGALPDGWTAAVLDRNTGARTEVLPGGTYAFTAEMAEGSGARAPWLPAPTERAARGASTAYDSGERFALVVTPAAVTTNGEDGARGRFGLDAPAPNPARGAVRLSYALADAGEATLTVYDALGREVAVLASGEQTAGPHVATLDGSALSPGVYVVRLTAGAQVETRRITVVR